MVAVVVLVAACGDLLGIDEADPNKAAPSSSNDAGGMTPDVVTGSVEGGDPNGADVGIPKNEVTEQSIWDFEPPDDMLPVGNVDVKGWLSAGAGAGISDGRTPLGPSGPNTLDLITQMSGSVYMTRTVLAPRSITLAMKMNVLTPPASPTAVAAFLCSAGANPTALLYLVLHSDGKLGVATEATAAGLPFDGVEPLTLAQWASLKVVGDFETAGKMVFNVMLNNASTTPTAQVTVSKTCASVAVRFGMMFDFGTPVMGDAALRFDAVDFSSIRLND